VRLYLFDDAIADGWQPFALTRPVGEIRFGSFLLRERIERWTRLEADGHLTRPWLALFEEPGAPPVLEPDALPVSEDRLLLSSRFVPPEGTAETIGDVESSSEAVLLVARDAVVGCRLPPGTDNLDRAWLARPTPLPGMRQQEVGGEVLAAVWKLVRLGAERTARDVSRSIGEDPHGGVPPLPDGVWRLGDEGLRLHEGVTIEPGVVLDLRRGPIELGPQVRVLAGSRLEGPLWAGAGSRLLGGPISGLAAGPVSFLRGEIADVQTLGWVNKAHDGHLGHAVVGRWVNLGAGTTNSDLKNNYGTVRIGPPGEERDTGLLKLGCLVGDHARTAIGTMLDTGTIVGAGASLFGAGRPPKWIPPFTWGLGESAGRYRREAFLATAATVMERRGIELTPGARGWLGAVWDAAESGAGS
jgi:UDP-N-acetylglucosamine diphosphorylase/glucosamine-1-phosphate N-acetyltransferase